MCLVFLTNMTIIKRVSKRGRSGQSPVLRFKVGLKRFGFPDLVISGNLIPISYFEELVELILRKFGNLAPISTREIS